MLIGIIIFQGLIFAVMIFVLSQFMKGHVSGAVGHMQKMNDELIQQQAALKKKIADAEKEYRSKLAKVEEEVAARKEAVKKETSQTVEDARAQAMEEREKLINEAVATREQMRQEIMAQMEEKAIEHSHGLIAEFFTGELRKLVHESLVKDVMNGLADVKAEQFQIDSDLAQIISAQPLDAATKARVKKTLEDKLKRTIKFKEEVKPDLIGGLIVQFGSFVIDGSLTNRLKEAAARLGRETARRYQSSA